MQLVSPRVGLLNPNDKGETFWTDEQVRAKTGVEPSQIVDWLALMGDAVDNIPGVPGVGTKTAGGLLKRFGSAAELLGRLDEVEPEKLRGALRASAGAVRRNLKLVKLQDGLPCDFSPGELVEKPADAGRLAGLFRQWGFKGMLESLEPAPRAEQAVLI
jgi:DNA polymerase-1